MPNTIGIDAAVNGVPRFVADMATMQGAFDKATEALTKNTEALNKATDKLSSSAPKTKTHIDNLGDTFQRASNKAVAFISSLTGITEKSVRAGLAIGGIGVAVDRFMEAGIQGAKVTAVERGFERIATAAEVNSKKLLADMQKATVGMVSDFDLMQKANIQLTGLYEGTGKAFAEHMGELLNVARVQAKLTGQDFNQVFSSLMEGLKRNEFHMLANIGISIRAEEVYARYAASIGKTAATLNAAERQQAALNEVLRIGTSLTKVAGNIQEDAADKYAKFMATLSNLSNTISQAFEPAVRGIYDAINSIIEPFKNIVEEIAPYISAVFSFVGEAFSQVARLIGGLINAFHIGDAIKNFILGGAYIIGALATGMLKAFNDFVLPVIDTIAQGIADVLMGQSPPPKGPLHTIDIGGAKVLEAWLQGFTGVSLEPVEQVAGYVQMAMGEIAFFNRDQVAARRKELDDVLNPYIDKLNLLKASFDALKPSTDAAFNAIDRQLMVSVKALVKGDEQAAAMTRYLDASKSALQGYIDKQQEMIDNQQIQVSLIQAQQAEERVMLDIRERQLGPEDKTKAEKEKQAKEKQAGGGVAEPTAPFAGFGAGQPEQTDFEKSLNTAIGDVSRAFKGTGFDIEAEKAKTGIAKIGKYFDKTATTKTLQDNLKETYGSVSVDEIIGKATDPNTLSGKVNTAMLEAVKRADKNAVTSETKNIYQLSWAQLKLGGISTDDLRDEIVGVLGKTLSMADINAILAIAEKSPNSLENIIKQYIKDVNETQIRTSIEEKLGQSFSSIDAKKIVEQYVPTNKLEATFDFLTQGYDPETGAIKVSQLLNSTFSKAIALVDQDKKNITNIPLVGNIIASLADSVTTDDKAKQMIKNDLKFFFGSVLSDLDIDAIIKIASTTGAGANVTSIVNAYIEAGKDSEKTAALFQGQIIEGLNAIDMDKVDLATQVKRKEVADFVRGLFSNEEPTGKTSDNGPLNRVVEMPGMAGKAESGIAASIQNAITSSLSQDFKDKFAGMVSTFVYVDIQGAFNKSFTEIFSPSGKGNVFSKLLNFKDDVQSLVLNVMLFNFDAFLSETDTRLQQLPVMLVNSALNPMLTFFNEFKNKFIDGINSMTTSISGLFDNINTALGGYGMPKLGSIAGISVPDVPLIGAAEGGIFNMLQVGERGPELMGPAQQIAVLPATLTQDIKAILTGVMSVAAQPLYAGARGNVYNGGNTSYNTDRSMVNNFYGSNNAGDVARRLNYMRALGII